MFLYNLGDVVLQNGANSAVGQNVIQICRAWGLVSVNVIRDREDAIHLKKYLESLGADHVLTESELRKTKLFKEKKLAKPKLAFNCVGGPIGTEITRHIEKAGTLVTYGAMSRQPLALSAATLIFNDLRFRGFWMTAWNKEHAQDPKRQEMLSDVINMILKGDIRPATHAMIPFSDYKQALANTMTAQGMAGKKYILDFHETKNKI